MLNFFCEGLISLRWYIPYSYTPKYWDRLSLKKIEHCYIIYFLTLIQTSLCLKSHTNGVLTKIFIRFYFLKTGVFLSVFAMAFMLIEEFKWSKLEDLVNNSIFYKTYVYLWGDVRRSRSTFSLFQINSLIYYNVASLSEIEYSIRFLWDI